MLRPVPMARVLIVGSRDALPRAIETLYSLKLVHVVDHQEGKDELELGKPLANASELSETLVKVRSIVSILDIEEDPNAVPQGEVAADARDRVLSLELKISEEDANRRKIQALVDELAGRIDDLAPFVSLPLRLEDYRGYDTIEVLVGRTTDRIIGLESVTPEFESFEADELLAVFVVRDRAEAMRVYLADRGFVPQTIPTEDGDPRELVIRLTAERERWEQRLSEVDARLSELRKRFADFLIVAKAHLEAEVDKAEAPLRFAVTEHAFVAEGWVPAERLNLLRDTMRTVPDLTVEALEENEPIAGLEEAADEPPVLLKHAKAFKPLEMLTRLFGTPSYHEIDPSTVVAFAFGLMFGLMVGDAGYGLVWMVYGIWLLRRWRTRRWDFWKNLLVALIFGGFWSFLFGTFVFAEAFGIPFHAPVEAAAGSAEAFNWSQNILGLNIPIYPLMEKLHQVADFMTLSIVIAYVHLGIGLIFGIVDEYPHGRKHAMGKLGWFLLLTSIFSVIMARAARWPGLGHAVWYGPFFWFPKAGLPYDSLGFTATNPIPWASFGLLAVGLGLIIATEANNLLEIITLLANTISYARIAGIGVAEEAVIFAFNTIGLTYFIFPGQASGNLALVIGGSILIAVFNVLVFLLATLSSSIQSIRLNYVEFFLKFYKGTGRAFRPFGERSVQEV